MNAPTTSPPFPTLQAPSVLLLGPPGSGKTHSVVTLLRSGLEVFVLATEPNAIDTLLDAVAKEKLDLSKLHWHYAPPASQSHSSLQQFAKTVNTLSFEDMTKMKGGIEKPLNNQIMKFLLAMQNFVCERDGRNYGDVTSWGPERAFVIDSLSGLNILSMANAVGNKPTPAPGEWGIAMKLEEDLINMLTSSLRCYFVLIAHLDRVVDEVSGFQRVVPAALGSKLGPKIGRFFSEVVLTKREAKGETVNYYWSTSDTMADLKNRSLAVGATLPPSFAPIVEAYQRRLASLGKAA